MYADVHLHLYEADDPKRIASEAGEEGINLLLTAGEDIETSRRSVELTELPNVYAAVGIHPARVNISFDIKELEVLLDHPKVIAVGEVGLDAKYEKFGVPLEKQREVFLRMLDLAKEYDLPVSIHSGRSYREVIEILFRYDVRAHLHWYSGSISLALEAAASGIMFSLGPVILHYKNYNGLVESLPLESLMTETDYPVRIGGVENHPRRVKEVVQRIAEVKSISVEKVRETLYNNALSFFRVRP